MTSIARVKRQITIRGYSRRRFPFHISSYSPSLPLDFSRKGSLLYYNPLPHRSSRNESLAGVTIGADTCRGGTARSRDERAVSDIRSRAGDDLPVMGLIFCSLAISVEASCHSLVMVLGGAVAGKGKRWHDARQRIRSELSCYALSQNHSAEHFSRGRRLLLHASPSHSLTASPFAPCPSEVPASAPPKQLHSPSPEQTPSRVNRIGSL
jgi:hypothetical protein